MCDSSQSSESQNADRNTDNKVSDSYTKIPQLTIKFCYTPRLVTLLQDPNPDVLFQCSCIGTADLTCSSQTQLCSTPLLILHSPQMEVALWWHDAECLGISLTKAIESEPLPCNSTSACKAKLFALIWDLQLEAGMRCNIYTGSAYAFHVPIAHVAILKWKGC